MVPAFFTAHREHRLVVAEVDPVPNDGVGNPPSKRRGGFGWARGLGAAYQAGPSAYEPVRNGTAHALNCACVSTETIRPQRRWFRTATLPCRTAVTGGTEWSDGIFSSRRPLPLVALTLSTTEAIHRRGNSDDRSAHAGFHRHCCWTGSAADAATTSSKRNLTRE